jgi:hypothetical protein
MPQQKIKSAADVLRVLRSRGLDIRLLGGDRNRPVIHKSENTPADALTDNLKQCVKLFRDELIECVITEQQQQEGKEQS